MREYPRNREAEIAILGNLILEPDRFEELSDLQAAHFYEDRHRRLYQWIEQRRSARKPIDTLILADALNDPHLRRAVGGLAYALSLPDRCGIAENIGYYAARIVEAATRRALLATLEGSIAALYEGAELGETLATIETATRSVDVAAGEEWTDSRSLSVASHEALIQRATRRQAGELIGLPTGIAALDRVLGGLRPNKLYIVGGRPGMGKTSFALGVALAAAEKGGSVGFVSREMTGVELWDRLVAIVAGVDGVDIRDGRIEDDHPSIDPRYWRSESDKWRAIEGAYEYLGSLPIYVAERATTQREIRSAALRLHARSGLDLLIVDYLQRVKGTGDTLPEKIGSIPIGCKSIARDDLHIPVMLLTQLNRTADGDGNPTAAAAKGSGDIEQEADAMIYPIREALIDPEAAPEAASIHVPKNRAGMTGRVICGWNGPRTQYYDLTRPPAPLGVIGG